MVEQALRELGEPSSYSRCEAPLVLPLYFLQEKSGLRGVVLEAWPSPAPPESLAVWVLQETFVQMTGLCGQAVDLS